MIRKQAIWLLLLFLLAAGEASACPGCTYDRMLANSWHIKWAAVNTLVPLVVVANRLNVVRFFYVLIPYLFLAFQFHSFLFWNTFGLQSGALQTLASVAWFVWALNLIGVALLYGVSRFSFFRWNKEKGLAVWQPIAYSLAVLFISILMAR